jgi:hypothetical protein
MMRSEVWAPHPAVNVTLPLGKNGEISKHFSRIKAVGLHSQSYSMC